MLRISVHESEQFNEATSEFVLVNEQTLVFEHSLFSISKWESEFQKPFLSEVEKTPEETVAYFHHMLQEPVSDSVLNLLTQDDVRRITEYITSPMTATTLTATPKKGPGTGEFITSELMYYYMVALNIPMECDRWHLNRLVTLIKITNIKNQPPKKMSNKDAVNSQRAANAARKAQLGTTG